jgi:hypothetical protein
MFIVGIMAMSMNDKPNIQQTQLAKTIFRLVKEPSTTGTGQQNIPR